MMNTCAPAAGDGITDPLSDGSHGGRHRRCKSAWAPGLLLFRPIPSSSYAVAVRPSSPHALLPLLRVC